MLTPAQLNVVASALADKPVTVSCEVAWEDPLVTGYVMPAEDGTLIPIIHLPYASCQRLFVVDTRKNPFTARALYKDRFAMDIGTGGALETLEHEATHLRTGSLDESFVECYAYSHRSMVLRVVEGVSGHALPSWYRSQVLWGMAYAHSITIALERADC